MPSYRRQKEFYGGYLAKYMFIKKCRTLKLDPTVEFFRHAGVLYNKEMNDELDDEYETDIDRSDDENEIENDDEFL